jgi:hypothetical protein
VSWFIPIIPAIQEAEVGGSQSEASLGKSVRLYLKNKLKAKEQVVRALEQQVQGSEFNTQYPQNKKAQTPKSTQVSPFLQISSPH